MAEEDIKVTSIAEDCCTTQLIDSNGNFNVTGLHNFIDAVNLHRCGLSYAVVAIMGPQSSGKSTLLNHLFYTNFREMDAYRGRSQTTKGIWIANAVGIKPTTIVMDLEGTDSRERGEDDTTFEKQIALFALALADVVLINMWCHDIGREQAANRPLLKTVFQVMMRLFTPRKTTLLFVIRDKTKTPLELLEPILRDDIYKIWSAVPKPQEYMDTPLSEFFNVEVTALPSYEEKEEQFKEQVSQLRRRFFHSISPGGIAGDRRGVVPASGFAFSAQQIWKIIKENKDLDLPAHKIMVAAVRCEEIANEKLNQLTSDKEWLALEQAVQTGVVPHFGKRLDSILDSYLSKYDMETFYFEETVRAAKRQQLLSKALQLVHPTYLAMLGHLRSNLLERFKNQFEQTLSRGEGFAASVRICSQSCLTQFDRECSDAAIKYANFDASKVRDKLRRDIEAYASSVCSEKLSKLMSGFEKALTVALTEPLESLFSAGGKDMWASIRKLLNHETNSAITRFSTAVAGFELEPATFGNMVQNLKEYARRMIEKKAREEAGKVLIRMKDRFATVFSHDRDSMPRVWTGKEDIKGITKEARAESLKLLAAMAAIRLDEKPDQIESILFSALFDRDVSTPSRVRVSEDPLASSTWGEFLPENTLITPVQCKSLWRQFIVETEYTVAQAISAQEAYKRANNWLPPTWAILAMVVLGFNEFMLLLRNPLYLLILFVILLLGKALWVQIDIPGEFRHGTLAGLISLSTRFLPTLMNLLRLLAEEAHGHPSQEVPRHAQVQTSRNLSSSPTAITRTIPDSSSSVSSDITAESGLEHTGLTHRRLTDTEEDVF